MRLRGCAGWSAPLLFAYGIRHIFTWPGPLIRHVENKVFVKKKSPTLDFVKAEVFPLIENKRVCSDDWQTDITCMISAVAVRILSFLATACIIFTNWSSEPAHEIMVLIIQATRKGSGEPAHPRLRIRAVSPEPSLFAHMKYRSRRRVRRKVGHLAPLDGCACTFEKWVYGGRKVPWSCETAQIKLCKKLLYMHIYVCTSWLRNLSRVQQNLPAKKWSACSDVWWTFHWALYALSPRT